MRKLLKEMGKSRLFTQRMLSKQGSVLFFVLVVMSFMIVLTSAVYYTVANGRKAVVSEYSDAQAFQTATDILNGFQNEIIYSPYKTDLHILVFGDTCPTGSSHDTTPCTPHIMCTKADPCFEGEDQGYICKDASHCSATCTLHCDSPCKNHCTSGGNCRFTPGLNITGAKRAWMTYPNLSLDELIENGYLFEQEAVKPDNSHRTDGHFIKTTNVTTPAGSGKPSVIVYINRYGDIVVQVSVEYKSKRVAVSRVFTIDDINRFVPKLKYISASDSEGMHWQWKEDATMFVYGATVEDGDLTGFQPDNTWSRVVAPTHFLSDKTFGTNVKVINFWAKRLYDSDNTAVKGNLTTPCRQGSGGIADTECNAQWDACYAGGGYWYWVAEDRDPTVASSHSPTDPWYGATWSDKWTDAWGDPPALPGKSRAEAVDFFNNTFANKGWIIGRKDPGLPDAVKCTTCNGYNATPCIDTGPASGRCVKACDASCPTVHCTPHGETAPTSCPSNPTNEPFYPNHNVCTGRPGCTFLVCQDHDHPGTAGIDCGCCHDNPCIGKIAHKIRDGIDDSACSCPGDNAGGRDPDTGELTFNGPGVSWPQMDAFHTTGNAPVKDPAIGTVSVLSTRTSEAPLYFDTNWAFLATAGNATQGLIRSNVTTSGNLVLGTATVENFDTSAGATPLEVTVGGDLYLGGYVSDVPNKGFSGDITTYGMKSWGTSSGEWRLAKFNGNVVVRVHGDMHIYDNQDLRLYGANVIYFVKGDIYDYSGYHIGSRAGNRIDESGAIFNVGGRIIHVGLSDDEENAVEYNDANVIMPAGIKCENDDPTKRGTLCCVDCYIHYRTGINCDDTKKYPKDPTGAFGPLPDTAKKGAVAFNYSNKNLAALDDWDYDKWDFCTGAEGSCATENHGNPLCDQYNIRVTEAMKRRIHYINQSTSIQGVTSVYNQNSRAMVLIDTGIGANEKTIQLDLNAYDVIKPGQWDPPTMNPCDVASCGRYGQSDPYHEHCTAAFTMGGGTFSWKPRSLMVYESTAVMTLGDGATVFYIPESVNYQMGRIDVGGVDVGAFNNSYVGPFNLAVGGDTTISSWINDTGKTDLSGLADCDATGYTKEARLWKLATHQNALPAPNARVESNGDWGAPARSCANNPKSLYAGTNLSIPTGGSCDHVGCFLSNLMSPNNDGKLRSAAELELLGIQRRNHKTPLNLNVFLAYNGTRSDAVQIRVGHLFAGIVYMPNAVFNYRTAGAGGSLRATFFMGSIFAADIDIRGDDHFIATLPGGGVDIQPNEGEKVDAVEKEVFPGANLSGPKGDHAFSDKGDVDLSISGDDNNPWDQY